ncbi:hypothetical protein B0H19DRAFT_1147100 [Mycena capillaripes]|nr:hypothetical protein B0H19DRAFT_1147100 [Mycena capillaripes]
MLRCWLAVYLPVGKLAIVRSLLSPRIGSSSGYSGHRYGSQIKENSTLTSFVDYVGFKRHAHLRRHSIHQFHSGTRMVTGLKQSKKYR